VQVLPDWAEERYPLHAYHPSRHLPPAKVRAFLDFVVASIAEPVATATPGPGLSAREGRQAQSDDPSRAAAGWGPPG
jgi:hypothetical protein